MELFKLLGTIAIDNAQAKKAIDETAAKADSGSKKIESPRTSGLILGLWWAL